MKRPLPFPVILVVLGAAVLVGACGKSNPDSAKKETPREEAVRPVRSIVLGPTAVSEAMYLPGEVRARYEQRLGFRVGGKIASRKIEVGETVKVGQLLATLDGQDVAPQINAQAAQLESARANTKFQAADLKRQQELRDKGFISASAMQRQELSVETAAAQERAAAASLANAQNGLAFQSLRADRAGVVVGIDAEVGSVVTAGQSIVRLAQLGEREIVVNLPERSVGTLSIGQTYVALIEAADHAKVPVKLREISPAADALSRTYPARFSILKPSDAIKLGMTATVRIDTDAANALVVPMSAVVTRDGQPRIWIINDTMTVQPVPVSTGALTATGITILSGLAPGQRVVTAGANLLSPGQKVRLETPPVPTAQVAPSTGIAAGVAK